MNTQTSYERCIRRNLEIEWAYDHGLLSPFVRDMMLMNCDHYKYNLHGYSKHDEKQGKLEDLP
jgi:hypothetical protein